MSISANNMLLNMQITIKELNDKHQLNPNNNGVTTIDRCMCLVNGELGIGEITHICAFEENSLCRIDWDGGHLIIPATTYILKEDGKFGRILDGTINRADKLLIQKEMNMKQFAQIIDITPISNSRTLIYKIRSKRGNYILENGVVVLSD